MKPGKELDALIAEKVMGFEKQWQPLWGKHHWLLPNGLIIIPASWSPSTDIAAAWEVVKKLTADTDPYFQLSMCDVYTAQPRWIAEFDLDRPLKRVSAKADTAPHAICLAALKALGLEGV